MVQTGLLEAQEKEEQVETLCAVLAKLVEQEKKVHEVASLLNELFIFSQVRI